MVFGGHSSDSYYDEGITASLKGDVQQAVGFFERAISLDPSNTVAYHQLGKCYLRLGQPEKAERYLKYVLQSRPDIVAARVDLGYAFLGMGRYPEARQTFGEVVAVKPDNSRAQVGFAYCAFNEGNWDGAMALAQTALDKGGASFAALFLLGRAAVLAQRPDVAGEAFQQAQVLLEKSIESSPEQPEGYYLRGEIEFSQQRFTDAMNSYLEAETRVVAGTHYVAYGEHFTLVDVLAKIGLCMQRLDLPGRREMGSRVLELDPKNKIGMMLFNS